MQKSFHQFRLLFLFGVVSLVVGIAIGILFSLQARIVLAPNQYQSNSPYHFINPLLSCGDDNFSRIQNGQVLNLQDKINAFITSQKQQGILDDASVYFRELNGGQSLLINPDLQFVPASLLKVPLAMSVVKEPLPGVIPRQRQIGEL